jgi:DNA repair exonuclease SbcCD nuclease subunit
MKIIHTSDLHLKSPLTSKLSAEKAVIRAKELEESFARLCDGAEKAPAKLL